MITAGPTGQFGFHGEVGIGNFQSRRYKATVNTDAWNGLSARFTLGHSQQNGDVQNTATKRTFQFPEPFGAITTNDRGGDTETDAGLLALRYTGVKNLKLDYKFDFTNWKGTMNYRQIGSIDGAPCDPANAPAACLLPLMTAVSPFDPSFQYKSELAVPLETGASNRVRGHSLVGEYTINNNLTAKYIGGYREYKLKTGGNQVWGASEYVDTNGVAGAANGVFAPLFAIRDEAQHQQSHELQLIGKAGPIDWLAGLFYFEEAGHVNNPVMLFKSYRSDGVVNPVSVAGFDYFVGQNVRVRNQSTAAYVHGTWHVADVDLSGGLRYTKDKRSEHVIAGGLIGAVTPGDQDFTYDGHNTDYDLSATYKLSKDSNVYAKYATGYVSGGTLFGGRFDPDKMKAIELGFKSSFFERKLRFNAALFQQRRKDVQIEGFTQIGYFMGKGADIRSDGIELEATVVPRESSLMLASVTRAPTSVVAGIVARASRS
jgi:iron complex outermembrane receptor protein